MPLETPRTYVNLVLEPDDPPRRGMRHGRLIAGIGALAALGLAGGFLLAPMMDAPDREASTPAPAAPTQDLNIVVDRTQPTETGGILPPIESAPAQSVHPEEPGPTVVTTAPPSASPRPKAAAASPPGAASAPAARTIEPPVTRPQVSTPPPPVRRAGRARPSFNCRYARTVSERMICVDPALAAADRRMVQAYRQAIQRGIPEPELRRQQDIWLGVRESAARYGPEGVAQAYEERTAQLQAMAR